MPILLKAGRPARNPFPQGPARFCAIASVLMAQASTAVPLPNSPRGTTVAQRDSPSYSYNTYPLCPPLENSRKQPRLLKEAEEPEPHKEGRTPAGIEREEVRTAIREAALPAPSLIPHSSLNSREVSV